MSNDIDFPLVCLKVLEGGSSPTIKTETDIGFDLKTPKDIIVNPGKSLLVDTLVKVSYIHPRFWIQLREKSGLAMRGLAVLGGIIDTGYRGNLGVILHNTTDQIISFSQGDSIAQGIIMMALLPYDKLHVDDESLIPTSSVVRGEDGGLWREQEKIEE